MAKKRTKSITKRKTTSRSRTTRKTKKPFGGYAISFNGRKETLEQVFGKTNITPSEMTKKLWKFIKNKKLGHK